MTLRSRRFFIETWGCQMNELDSQRMAGQLMEQGLLPTREPEEADVILLNSCSVREKAEQKVFSRLGELRRFKRRATPLWIGLCGCVAQQEGKAALDRVPDLDFVVGPARIHELGEIVARREAGERVVATGFPRERRYEFDSIARGDRHKGMVTVIEGCDKSCTFCIVPQTRGPERCRPLTEIVHEIDHLLALGLAEIELLGQTVNHWREPGGEGDFADLLDAVAVRPGLRRLRFVTSYPRDFSQRMIGALERHAVISDYLHLPVQSGSDRVLRRMGRGYTREEYLTLVARLRRARPSLALSTDLIVGFPGESAADFEATLTLVREVRFASLFAFCYSPRPGTAALRLGEEVSRSEAECRLSLLLAEQEQIQRQLNEAMVGRVIDILVTGPGREEGQMSGRTDCHRIVHFAAPHGSGVAVGGIQSVRIERALSHSLLGVPLQ